jgi:hypothetical protein
MNKYKSKVVGKVRCFRSGELATITKSSQNVLYCYSIHCAKCGYRGGFTQKHFDRIKQHDGLFPATGMLVGEIKG